MVFRVAQHTQETDASLESAFTGIILIHFHTYKITVMHELKQPDYASRILFCNWLLQNVHDGLITETDEAWNNNTSRRSYEE
jgi:hypothetical protein